MLLSLSLSLYIYIYIYKALINKVGKAGFPKLSTCLPQQPIKTLQNNGGFATENLV
jgi:hypothetical protein